MGRVVKFVLIDSDGRYFRETGRNGYDVESALMTVSLEDAQVFRLEIMGVWRR